MVIGVQIMAGTVLCIDAYTVPLPLLNGHPT